MSELLYIADTEIKDAILTAAQTQITSYDLDNELYESGFVVGQNVDVCIFDLMSNGLLQQTQEFSFPKATGRTAQYPLFPNEPILLGPTATIEITFTATQSLLDTQQPFLPNFETTLSRPA